MADDSELPGVELLLDRGGVRLIDEDGLFFGVGGLLDVPDDETGEREGDDEHEPGRELRVEKNREVNMMRYTERRRAGKEDARVRSSTG